MATSLVALTSLAQVGTGIGAFFAGQDQAKQIRKLGRVAEEERRRQGRRLLGRQRVAFAKGGVEVGTGSPLNVAAQTEVEEDFAARLERYRFSVAAENVQTRSRMALLSGITSAAGTLAQNPTLTSNAIGSISKMGTKLLGSFPTLSGAATRSISPKPTLLGRL